MEIVENTVRAVNVCTQGGYGGRRTRSEAFRTHASFFTFRNALVGLNHGRSRVRKGDKLILVASLLGATEDAPNLEVLAYHILTQDIRTPNRSELIGGYALGGILILLGLVIVFEAVTGASPGMSLVTGVGMAGFGIWLSLPTPRRHRAWQELTKYLITQER